MVSHRRGVTDGLGAHMDTDTARVHTRSYATSGVEAVVLLRLARTNICGIEQSKTNKTAFALYMYVKIM